MGMADFVQNVLQEAKETYVKINKTFLLQKRGKKIFIKIFLK